MRRFLLLFLFGCAPEGVAVPTYYGEVGPIVAEHCAGCHQPGGVAAPSFVEAENVVAHASLIRAVTAARVMPPWPAASCRPLVEARGLSDEQIATIGEWAAASAPLGPASALPPAPIIEARLENPSVTLDSGEYYLPPPEATDEYRCFLVDPGLVSDMFMTAYAVRLDQREQVHHVQLYAFDDFNAETAARRADAADEGPGFRCDSGPAASRYVGVWATGELVRRFPAGSGIQLHARRKMVFQVHYHRPAGGEYSPDRTTVELELARGVERIGRIYPFAVPDDLILAPGLDRVTVEMPWVVPEDAKVWGARIHMHTLGADAQLDLGDACLLSIPRWDFGWQLFYFFEQPIDVRRGDALRLRCTYDTRSRTEEVRWGVRTEDEMCLGYLYYTR